jgi:hypothetical protein
MPDVGDIGAAIRLGSSPRRVFALLDQRIAALAAQQHGVVSRWQLLELGLAPGAIQRRIALGRLHRVHEGVYAVGHRNLTVQGRWMAAVLACGPDALLSHRSAGGLWVIRQVTRPLIDVTAPRTRRGRRGIDLHRARNLDAADRTTRNGIPVTTVARTLIDLAEVIPFAQLERAFERADRAEMLDVRELEAACDRARGRHGMKPITRLLGAWRPRPEMKSELEHRFAELCDTRGLPMPLFNEIVEGLEVACVWPDAKLIVELDGYEHHRGRASFERDRERDSILALAGYRVVRFTWRRLEAEPEHVATTVRDLLSSRNSTQAEVGPQPGA